MLTPPLTGSRLLHTMLRVADLDLTLDFYIDLLGMHLLRRRDYPEGRFTWPLWAKRKSSREQC